MNVTILGDRINRAIGRRKRLYEDRSQNSQQVLEFMASSIADRVTINGKKQYKNLKEYDRGISQWYNNKRSAFR
jgi:hypothetical protein